MIPPSVKIGVTCEKFSYEQPGIYLSLISLMSTDLFKRNSSDNLTIC